MNNKRIYLRALEIDDYKTSINWRRDDNIWSMLGGTKYFVSEMYEKKWVEETIFNTKDIKLAICLNENDLYIGNVYITNINYINRSCESHVLIGNRSYWNQGYAQEALKEILDFVFRERGMNRVVAYILEDNIGSIKMHKKVGYQHEGILRQSIFKDGTFKNQVIMSILWNDFQKEHKEK